MVFEEVMRLFLASRKRGRSGAKVKAQPSTMKLYEHWIGHFFDFLREQGRTEYEQIKKADIDDFLDWMDTAEGKKHLWAKATKLKVLRSMRSLFKFVAIDEDCTDDKNVQFKDWTKALGVIEKSPRREYMPTMDDIRKFRLGFNTKNRWGHRNYVAFSLMLDTGARVGEVCSITLDNTKLEDRTVIVSGKTGTRLVPMTPEMVRLIKGWMRIREKTPQAKAGSKYLFVGKYNLNCTPQVFQKAFRKIATKVGMPEFTPHTLRHAFCTYYLKRGGSMDKLRHIVGHSDFRMLIEYEHLAKVGGDAIKAEQARVSPLAQAS